MASHMPHERVRPDWWMGVNGAEPKLPKTRNEGQKVSYFDGFVLEEIFWNWRHNGFFNTRELDPYISYDSFFFQSHLIETIVTSASA